MSADPINVAGHLLLRAATRPDAPAVVLPTGFRRGRGFRRVRTVTFAELEKRSADIASGLAGVGVTRFMRVALMVTPSPDFFALTFALFRLGAVPVLIDPGMGVRGLGRCLDQARPEAFIGVPRAHLARKYFGWAARAVRLTVTTSSRRFGLAQYTLDALAQEGAKETRSEWAESRTEDMAAILFTSGSTGPAKGAVYTHGIFTEQVRILREVYGIEQGEVDLPTFPLFALFGPALGMTAVIPEMDFTRPATIDPAMAIHAMERFGVTSMFGSPAVVNRLGRHGAALPGTLRRVISAGAPASVRALERLARLLPAACEVHTPYGATEALPVASIGSRDILTQTRPLTERGAGVCVGRPVPGVVVEVLPLHERPVAEWDDALALPPGCLGEFVVRGEVVTPAYFERPEATALAKIPDPAGGVWHRMGDVGYIDDSGRLWFAGRKSHVVHTPVGLFPSTPCEAIADAHPAVFRTALVGVPTPEGTVPVLCVERDPNAPGSRGDALLAEVRALLAAHAHTSPIVELLAHPGFPVDVRHNAKIFREKLAVWATAEFARLGRVPRLGGVPGPLPTADTLGATA